jgi:hypothetical protein
MDQRSDKERDFPFFLNAWLKFNYPFRELFFRLSEEMMFVNRYYYMTKTTTTLLIHDYYYDEDAYGPLSTFTLTSLPYFVVCISKGVNTQKNLIFLHFSELPGEVVNLEL